MANLVGKMVEVIKASGKMVSKMAEEHIKIRKEYKKMGHGLTVKRSNGTID